MNDRIWRAYKPPKFMEPARYDDAPDLGVKNPVLPLSRNVRIYDIYSMVTWTGQPSPLEIWITLEGTIRKGEQIDPESATPYYVTRHPLGVSAIFALTKTLPLHAFLVEGRLVKVEVEITGGTVSNLKCFVQWGQW